MEITLNDVKSLDQLRSIVAAKYPSVKLTRGYLCLKFQGIKLTIEPKKNGVYDVNKDVPILKYLFMVIAIVVLIYVLAALIYPPMLAQQHLLLLIGAVIFVSVAGFFNRKAKPAIADFCRELEEMCK